MKKTDPRYLIDANGNKTAIVIPIIEYQELMEDLHDLSVIAERKDEPSMSFDELKNRLKEDGVI